MKVMKMVSKILYHCFKLLQIVVYGIYVGDPLSKGLYNAFTEYILFVLFIPTVAIYAASFRYGPSRVARVKFIHGASALLLYLVGYIAAAYYPPLNPLFWVAITIAGLLMSPVAIEGCVAFISMKRQSKPISDGQTSDVSQ